jgi:hypothetical protein
MEYAKCRNDTQLVILKSIERSAEKKERDFIFISSFPYVHKKNPA